MKLPKELIEWKFGDIEQLCEVIVRDCGIQYIAWEESGDTGTFAQWLERRYGLTSGKEKP